VALRHSEAVIVILIGACVVLALLTVFSLEPSDTQAKSKSGMFTGLVEVMRNWQRDWFELVELPNGPSQ